MRAGSHPWDESAEQGPTPCELLDVEHAGSDHKIVVDMAYGCMWYAPVDVASAGPGYRENPNGREPVDVGGRIKHAVQRIPSSAAMAGEYDATT
jgi:proline racemase